MVSLVSIGEVHRPKIQGLNKLSAAPSPGWETDPRSGSADTQHGQADKYRDVGLGTPPRHTILPTILPKE